MRVALSHNQSAMISRPGFTAVKLGLGLRLQHPLQQVMNSLSQSVVAAPPQLQGPGAAVAWAQSGRSAEPRLEGRCPSHRLR